MYAHTSKLVNEPKLWSPCEDEPIVASFFKQKKRAITNLKEGPKKGGKDLRANIELYLVQVVQLSVQYVNNVVITRRHVEKRLRYYRTFIFLSFFPKVFLSFVFLLIFPCVIS